MQPFQLRVVKEKEELDERLLKLSSFVFGPVFKEVDPEEQVRLLRQHNLMSGLSSVLGERIAAFPPDIDTSKETP